MLLLASLTGELDSHWQISTPYIPFLQVAVFLHLAALRLWSESFCLPRMNMIGWIEYVTRNGGSKTDWTWLMCDSCWLKYDSSWLKWGYAMSQNICDSCWLSMTHVDSGVISCSLCWDMTHTDSCRAVLWVIETLHRFMAVHSVGMLYWK